MGKTSLLMEWKSCDLMAIHCCAKRMPISSPISWLSSKKWSRLQGTSAFSWRGSSYWILLGCSRQTAIIHFPVFTCFWFPQYGGGKGTPDDSMDAYRSGLAAKQLNLRSTSLAPQYKSRWRSLGSGAPAHRSCPSYLILLLNVHPMMPHVRLTFREVVPLIELSILGKAHTHKSSGE